MSAADIAAIITAVTALVAAITGLAALFVHRNGANARLASLERRPGAVGPGDGESSEVVKLSSRN